jgi:hypothetical protein
MNEPGKTPHTCSGDQPRGALVLSGLLALAGLASPACATEPARLRFTFQEVGRTKLPPLLDSSNAPPILTARR